MAEEDEQKKVLKERADKLLQDFSDAEKVLNALKEGRVQLMTEMREAGCSWVDIGRQFGMSGPAVMYATGYAKRTAKSE